MFFSRRSVVCTALHLHTCMTTNINITYVIFNLCLNISAIFISKTTVYDILFLYTVSGSGPSFNVNLWYVFAHMGEIYV